MSYLYSRALVEEYSRANCSDGAASALLSTNPTQQAFSHKDKTTAFSRLFRFGMTFAPLTDDLGADVLTWFLGASLAKTSASRDEDKELTESEADCGQRWRESFAKYDRDTSSWRTRQHSLLGGLDEFSETWPKWGSMRNGECWERPTLERPTEESESGLWPTPTSSAGGPNHNSPQVKAGNHGINLEGAVVQKMWPTPKSRDWKDGKTAGTQDRHSPDLGKVVGQGPTTGALNPTWTEWLMGWPLGWTDLKPSETGKSHSAPPKHSESCAGG